ncbi:hypothetical protein Tco_0085291 [Tanacetum coccineum]
MSAKAKERKKEEIVVVRNFPEFLIHRLAPSGIGGVVIVLMRCQLTGNPGQRWIDWIVYICNVGIVVKEHGVSILIISDHDSLFYIKVFLVNAKRQFGQRLDMSHGLTTLRPLYGQSMVRFGKKGKLAPRFVGPFEIIKKISPVAYKLDLPEELDGVHDTFHVSNLKKCLADPTLQVPLDDIQVDAKLNFVEEHVEILEKEFKKLKRSTIAIVKVRWNSKRGSKFTWEHEDQMKLK